MSDSGELSLPKLPRIPEITGSGVPIRLSPAKSRQSGLQTRRYEADHGPCASTRYARLLGRISVLAISQKKSPAMAPVKARIMVPLQYTTGAI
jgi:hypothetical protein